jgi:hypothetical protein
LPFELLLRLLFVADAPVQRLIDGDPGRGGLIKFATPRNIELRHLISHSDDQLRTQNNHRD